MHSLAFFQHVQVWAGSWTRDDYTRQARIACDDRHDDPYDAAARAGMFSLHKRGGPILQSCRR